MILELHVRDFALIKDVRIEFEKGFNVLTGETGAGKSLMIDALLAIAGKGSPDFVRSGCEQAVVETIFSCDDSVKALFEEIGEEDFISLRKVISKSGKTKQYINGNFVSQARMKELFGRLLHVYGQSETKDLYDESYQRELYDLYCDTKEALKALKEALLETKMNKKAVAELVEKEASRIKEIDFLEYQINEIRAANLCDDNEEEHLIEIRNRLLARTKVIKNMGTAFNLLYAGEANVFDMLSQAGRLVSELNMEDKFFLTMEEGLKDVAEKTKDIALQIKSFTEELENSEEDINRVEGRLDLIYRLKKKYGGTISEIRRFLVEQEKRLEELKNIDVKKDAILKALDAGRDKVVKIADSITEKRKKVKETFEKIVSRELTQLGMPKAVFKVNLIRQETEFPEDISLNGREVVQFLFSSHSGEEPKPLSKIASGGELSRVMLAIKNVIPKEPSMTVIFDEVDAGVGGKTAEMLGRKLREISAHHQTICITHLPQVAVFGEKHFKVEKTDKGNSVDIEVKSLNRDERIEEITRMLGGDSGSKGAEYAAELLKKAAVV